MDNESLKKYPQKLPKMAIFDTVEHDGFPIQIF